MGAPRHLAANAERRRPILRSALPYVWAALISGAATGLCRVMAARFDRADLIMVYLLGVVVVASRFGRGPASLASVLSVACFDFFFVPPHLTFAVANAAHLWTFAVMLTVGLLIAALTERSRLQAKAAQEREREAQRAAHEAEQERLRSSLLSSVSHDLRTPLAVITGATSALLDDAPKHDEATRRELIQTVYEEAERLNRLIGSLLDMTRMESGVRVKKEWQPLEEVVGAALTHLEAQLGERSVRVAVPPDLPLVPVDGFVMELVVRNLLENAIKYSTPGTPIEITASPQGNEVEVSVADRGPGLKPGDEEKIFEKFYRSPRPGGASGVGLGLAIARAVVIAHGGRIWAERRAGGGAVFRFTIPLDGGGPPSVDAERPPSDPERRPEAP